MKLIICLCLSAFTASMIHTFEWESTARRQWHDYAVAVHEEEGQ